MKTNKGFTITKAVIEEVVPKSNQLEKLE